MIDDSSIEIFNYIFSINENERNRIKNLSKEHNKKILLDMIEKIGTKNDFFSENKKMFNKECLDEHKWIIDKEYNYDLLDFPRLTGQAKQSFLEFKASQIKKEIDNNGDILRNAWDKIFINIEDIGRKEILNYCKTKNIIDFEETKTVIPGGQTGIAMILYENIKPVIYKKIDESEIKQPVIQNIFNGSNYGTLNQINNVKNNDKLLYQTILEKLELLQKESNLTNKKVEEIKEACNKKDKNKIRRILKEITMGTGTNLIANGILMMFGLM